MEKIKGREILLEMLVNEGVDTVFCPLSSRETDFLCFIPEKYRDKIKFVKARHEQAAAHMADGYARATGRPGVLITLPGPYGINTVTGLTTAHMDSAPIICIVADLDPWNTDTGDTFISDHIGITQSCTKHNYLVKKTSDITKTIREAIHVAKTGRPGPVLVDIPFKVLAGEEKFTLPKLDIRGYKEVKKGDPAQVKRAVEMILKSKRPVIFGGGGLIISGATDELVKFAHAYKIPVTNTLMGIGSYPTDDPFYVNWIGMHGAYNANMAVHESDLVISIGARFDDRATGGNFEKFAPKAKIIHIDIDPSTIDKNIVVHCPIIGDAKAVLKQMLEIIPSDFEVDRSDWIKKIRDWDQEHPMSYSQQGSKIKTTYVIDKISEITNGEAIVAADVGQHQMWLAQFYRFKNPRAHITSGGLGTMGFGLPAAIGAKFGRPDNQVICVCGDGSFQMNMQEIATAVENEMDLKIIVLNNRHHGMVRQWQTLFFNSNYSSSYFEVLPDFVKIAKSYGASGFHITKPEEVEPSLKEGLTMKGVVLIEIEVDYEEMVYPMLTPGGDMSDMIVQPSDLA
ncbi:MAG: biosynthetic-type acetolactate synthase large subunit [Thermodesulfobacteriota bacterium]